MKIQNKHVDWEHRWIKILKENSYLVSGFLSYREFSP